MDWTRNVPLIKDGITTFTEGGLNPSLIALRDRTDFLYNMFLGVSGNVGYSVPAHGFSSACKKGMLVAVNPQTGLYEPAAAAWASESRADGSWKLANSSRVIGVLTTSIDSSGNGVIMCSGWSNDSALIKELAPDGKKGDYYLAPTSVDAEGNKVATGKAVHESVGTREISIYCYTYTPDGVLHIDPDKGNYGGHAHNHVTIKTPWVHRSQASGAFPADVVMVTDTSTDVALSNLLDSNPQKVCLVKNGSEVMEDNWCIVDSFICVDFTVLHTDILSIHAITPLTANEPIVRSVDSTVQGGLINITNAGGKVWVGVNDTPARENEYTGTCVSSVTNNGIVTGPVVQAIKAGPGIDITSYNDRGVNVPGVFSVSSKQYKGTMIDMSLCNLNQVIVGTAFHGIAYTFPANSTASLVGTIRIPNFSNANQAGEIVLVFQGNGSYISGMSARVLIQPTPEVGGSTHIPSSVTYTIPSIAGTNVGECYCTSIRLGGDTQLLHSDGLIICKLESAGGVEVNLISMSLRLL